ncbi:MAG: hypothetical protein H6806_03870 [Planctomycetes bacterium]|nr:hypothetical protein [Planctomycetota bacterium]
MFDRLLDLVLEQALVVLHALVAGSCLAPERLARWRSTNRARDVEPGVEVESSR